MLIELAVFLCLAGIASTCGFQNHEPLPLNCAPTQSAVTLTTPVPNLEVSSPYTYDIPLEAKVLQSVAPNPQNAYITQGRVEEYQRISSGGQAYLANPALTYISNPAVFKTVTAPVAVPVANKVTVEAHQQVTAHPPTATYVSSQPEAVTLQPVRYQTQTIVNRPEVQYVSAPVGNLHPVVQVGSKTVHETVTAHPPSVNFVTTRLPPRPFQRVQATVRRPVVQYVAAPVQRVQSEVSSVTTVPITPKKVTIEAHESVTAHPPPAASVTSPLLLRYPIQQRVQTVVNRPAVQVVSAPVTHVLNSAIQVASKTVPVPVPVYPPPASYVTSTVAPQVVHHVQKLVSRPAVQYVSQVQPTVSSEAVTVEAHQSVTAHPPTVQSVQSVVNPAPIQYVSRPINRNVVITEESVDAPRGVSQVHYSQSPVVPQPIPVPVIYNVEDYQVPQFVKIPPRNRVPVVIPQPIQVPVVYPESEARIRYNQKVVTPLIYTKSIVEKDHASADLVATQLRPGYTNYARAVTFSPASEVSSVSFNGLGVSYGW